LICAVLQLAAFGAAKNVKLLVEVSRHGARAPKHIYDLAFNKEKNFKTPMSLTEIGADMHYRMGRDFVSKNYGPFNETEVFVQSSNTERTQDSARSQLDGIFSKKFSWPIVNSKYDINTIPDKVDFLIHANHDCNRVTYLKDKINADPKTKQMFADLTSEYETNGFFAKLRKITGKAKASSYELLSISNYLLWAHKNNLLLKHGIDLSAEDVKLIELIKAQATYVKFLADPELEAI